MFSIQVGTKPQDVFYNVFMCLQLLMYVTLLLWWYIQLNTESVYNNQILTCNCDSFGAEKLTESQMKTEEFPKRNYLLFTDFWEFG